MASNAISGTPASKPFLRRLYNSFGYEDTSSTKTSGSGSLKAPPAPASSSSSSSSSASSSPNTSPEFAATRPLDGTDADVVDIKQLPQCWGHRGASAAYPENTLASFQQAILDGADGIESDVHISLDGTIVMFHDAYLNRTTNGKGLIAKQKYKDGIDQLRTTKLPAQRICTLVDLLDLLMVPANSHVLLNIDVKLDNEPDDLFQRIDSIVSAYPDWQAQLAPRLILGLWHVKYIEPAQRLLPYCRLAHIGVSPDIARKYFWAACSAFSLNYASLVSKDGEAFRAACRQAGKDLYVWTVNERSEMIQATKWGAKAVLTDRTADYLRVRGEMSKNFHTVASEVHWSHSWTKASYYGPYQTIYTAWETFLLHRSAGPMTAKRTNEPAPRAITLSSGDTSLPS